MIRVRIFHDKKDEQQTAEDVQNTIESILEGKARNLGIRVITVSDSLIELEMV